ncbi:MAG: RDD family protein [Bacteroidetes bacterium]|nr:RDD family protein [Bacteroidota bacterium]
MLLNSIIKVLPNRILSAIIDQISLVVFSLIIFSISDKLASTTQEINRIEVNTAIVIFSIFLNKDIYFGKSIGKNFIGLRVVSARTGNPASPIQCSLRNLFVLLWPLEALMLFFSPKRRIGDFVAGTKVQEDTEIGREVKWQFIQAILAVVGSFIFVFYLFNFIDSLGIMN